MAIVDASFSSTFIFNCYYLYKNQIVKNIDLEYYKLNKCLNVAAWRRDTSSCTPEVRVN